MKNFFNFIKVALASLVIISFVSFLPNGTNLGTAIGATIPGSVASFSTTLATSISDSDTSMSLSSIMTDDGVTLVDGKIYGFTIDQGTALEEFVIGTVETDDSTVNSMTRGVSVLTGSTSITALKKNHRRGATVKITDHPVITVMARILNGDETIPNILSYDSGVTPSAGSDLADKEYVDGVAVAGAPDANTTTKGIFEQSTVAELNAGSATGTTGAILAFSPADLASSIYGLQLPSSDQKAALAGTSGTPSSSNKYITEDDVTATSTASKIPRLNGSGKLDSAVENTIDIQTFNSSGTWTKPTGAKRVHVQAVGGGGSGAGGNNNDDRASGGGGGEYREAWFDADDLGSSETVTIGAGGTAATNGNGVAGSDTTFGSELTAKGGAAGTRTTFSTATIGGNGGSPLGTLNTMWGAGASAAIGGSGIYSGAGGGAAGAGTPYAGGSSIYGGAGGAGAGTSAASGGTSIYGGNGGASSADGAGTAGTQPGGGGGGTRKNGASGAGGAGQVIVISYF